MSELPEFCDTVNAREPVSRRERKAFLQRERRKRLKRVDFYADPETVAIIDSLRMPRVDGTASAILNRIVKEWAEASGIISVLRTRAGEGG